MQEASLDAPQRLTSPYKVRFLKMGRLSLTINDCELLMNRNDFVKEFVECLRNNSTVQSFEDTAEGTYDIASCLLIDRFESMTFSYPLVSQTGVEALQNELMALVTRKSGDILFPDYFVISPEFLNGLEYLIRKYEVFPFPTFSEPAKSEIHELLCDIAFIVSFMIPYVCLCESCPLREQKRLFKELNDGHGDYLYFL